MRPTPAPYRSYTCLLCRTRRKQHPRLDIRAYSLLATSLTRSDSLLPPDFNSETAKNLPQGKHGPKTTPSSPQDALHVAEAQDEKSKGKSRLQKDIPRRRTLVVRKIRSQQGEVAGASPKGIRRASLLRKRTEVSNQNLGELWKGSDRLVASSKGSEDPIEFWQESDRQPLARAAQLLRDELSEATDKSRAFRNWAQRKINTRKLKVEQLGKLGPQALSVLSTLRRLWGRSTLTSVITKLTILESILPHGKVDSDQKQSLVKSLVKARVLGSKTDPTPPYSQRENASPTARTDEEYVAEVLEDQEAESGSAVLAKDNAQPADDAGKEQSLAEDTHMQHEGTRRAGKKKGLVNSDEAKTKSTATVERSEPHTTSSRRQRGNIPQLGAKSYSVDANTVKLIPVQTQQPSLPTLTHDLQRVLFNPGIYHLQDPRSRVYNFDPYLKSLMPVTDFDFTALKSYVVSSEDDNLRQLANSLGKRYLSSSSQMTPVLSHFHYLLSNWRELDISTISRSFPEKHTAFAANLRAPASVFLRYKDGTYGIDANKEFDRSSILLGLGKSLEKLLTSSKEKFELYRRSGEQKLPEDERNRPETYHYSQLGDFLMRSQLDARDARLPGSGVFDVKTRAVISIRMNALDVDKGLGYQIRDRFGQFESYEREFYDMIRNAFIKYSLQVRMGNMDGIFVAYHNIESLFGFQYVSLPEMDLAIHGQADTTLGDREFKLSLTLMNRILDQATAKFPGRSLRMHFETRASTVRPFMYVFAEPMEEDTIQRMQANRDEAWLDLIEKLRQRVGAESESGNQHGDSSMPRLTDADTSFLDEMSQAGTATEAARSSAADDAKSTQPPQPELGCWLVTIQNQVNQVPVTRPTDLRASDKWIVDFDIAEISDTKKRQNLYEACQKRRQTMHNRDLTGNVKAQWYMQHLLKLAKKGRRWQEAQKELDSLHEPVILYGLDK